MLKQLLFMCLCLAVVLAQRPPGPKPPQNMGLLDDPTEAPQSRRRRAPGLADAASGGVDAMKQAGQSFMDMGQGFADAGIQAGATMAQGMAGSFSKGIGGLVRESTGRVRRQMLPNGGLPMPPALPEGLPSMSSSRLGQVLS